MRGNPNPILSLLRLTFFLCTLIAVFSALPVLAVTTELTYENWAQGFFTHNCVACHNSSLKGSDRFGAPRDLNFDRLDLIRQNANLIRDAVTGDNPIMPPMGVVWWWDRVSLREWLDAGLPGESDTLEPVDYELSETTLSYWSGGIYFSEPFDDNQNDVVDGNEFNHRYIEFYPREAEEDDFEGMILHRFFDIRKQSDENVVMTATEWLERNADWSEIRTRRLDYDPPIPILLGDETAADQQWTATVTTRERYWDGWEGDEPLRDETHPEQWIVTNRGLDTIDNGVILPMESLKVTQANLTTDTTHTWWFKKGTGLVRRETDVPSDQFIREVTREMNVITSEYPLYGPHDIQAASEEWLPFVGRDNELGYWHELEVQVVGIVSSGTGPTPTPTRTLAAEPTYTPVVPTPTVTEFPPGLPEEQPTATRTASPTVTSTHTRVPPPPPNPTPTFDPNDPNNYDSNKDGSVNSEDLLMFLKHWHSNMEEN